MSWRDTANRVIRETLEKHKPATEAEAKKLLSDAYPFGERAMHPYKIWLDAVKTALHRKYKIEAGVQLPIDLGLFRDDEPLYNIGELIIQDHISKFTAKEEALILRVYKKQKGFVSLQESKDLIEVNRIYRNEKHVSTDFLFNGERILTTYPPEFSERDGRFTTSIDYIEYH